MTRGVAEWDGIRDHQANNKMRATEFSHKAFAYHSTDENRNVGPLTL